MPADVCTVLGWHRNGSSPAAWSPDPQAQLRRGASSPGPALGPRVPSPAPPTPATSGSQWGVSSRTLHTLAQGRVQSFCSWRKSHMTIWWWCLLSISFSGQLAKESPEGKRTWISKVAVPLPILSKDSLLHLLLYFEVYILLKKKPTWQKHQAPQNLDPCCPYSFTTLHRPSLQQDMLGRDPQ